MGNERESMKMFIFIFTLILMATLVVSEINSKNTCKLPPKTWNTIFIPKDLSQADNAGKKMGYMKIEDTCGHRCQFSEPGKMAIAFGVTYTIYRCYQVVSNYRQAVL